MGEKWGISNSSVFMALFLLSGHFWWGLGDKRVPGIKARFAACKASTLPAVSLQPHKLLLLLLFFKFLTYNTLSNDFSWTNYSTTYHQCTSPNKSSPFTLPSQLINCDSPQILKILPQISRMYEILLTLDITIFTNIFC